MVVLVVANTWMIVEPLDYHEMSDLVGEKKQKKTRKNFKQSFKHDQKLDF